MEKKTVPAFGSREEIPARYTWDLSSMYPSDEAFLEALEAAQDMPGRFAAMQGTLGTAEGLLAFLRADDEADLELSKLSNYAGRRADEDTRDSACQDFESRVNSLIVAVMASYSWFKGEVLALGRDKVEDFFKKEPALELYRRALDRVFALEPHTLGPAEERLLAAAGEMGQGPETIFGLLNNADLVFEDALDSEGERHPVTHGSYIPLMTSGDRVLRENAFKSLYATYGAHRNTMAAILGAQCKQLKFFSEARRYESTLEAALTRNEIPTEVYTSLIEAVGRHTPALHRYAGLRKRMLGVDELHFWDLYVPVVGDVDMRFTYEEACELILEALEPMGEEYLSIVRRGLESRWVDVYETPGKRSGAYSAGGAGMQPVILMNFQGTLDDVFTLIHEIGHSVHTYLSATSQPTRYSNYVIFVAEVASTCNESLLMQHLLRKTTDRAERAYLVNHFLEMFRSTIYRQTMFAEFELEANRIVESGRGLTADSLCELYGRLNREQFGPDIVLDDEIRLEWARIPHFYYRYYVYQYATGFAAAIALSKRILDQGAAAVEDYLGFLRGGCSKTPIELLRGAGVDMASSEPIDSALAMFSQLVEELESLV